MVAQIKILMIFLLSFIFVIAKGQKNFQTQLVHLIEKKIFRPVDNALSGIVFIDYDIKTLKLKVINTNNSAFNKYVEDVIKDTCIVRLVKDSAVVGFVLPVFFITVNEDIPALQPDNLIFSVYAINNLLALFENLVNEKKRTVLNLIKIILYNRKRVE